MNKLMTILNYTLMTAFAICCIWYACHCCGWMWDRIVNANEANVEQIQEMK